MQLELRETPKRTELCLGGGYPIEPFLRYIGGLDAVAGLSVLEIGGEDGFDMGEFFRKRGASYHTVRLTPDSKQQSSVTVGNFMQLPGSELYDLIISLGVFEAGGFFHSVQQENGTVSHYYPPNVEVLTKLFGLTKKGGFQAIATAALPCIFRDDEITSAGFVLKYPRIRDYMGYLDLHRKNELLFFQRPT